MPGVTHWQVEPAEAGQKLLQFLSRRFDRAIPVSALQRWIRKGQVRVDGSRVGPYTRLKSGQEVRIPPHAWDEHTTCASCAAALTILHETPDLLILAKPVGLPVHSGSGHKDSVVSRIKARHAGSSWLPSPAHRLDRDTSGLLAVAKSYGQLRELHEHWRCGRVHKAYLAWVQGSTDWDEPALIINQAAKMTFGRREKMILGRGKDLASRVQTLVRTDKTSLTLIAPLSGRTHQIRVQLAGQGHPLLGDRKYAGPACPAGMLLHAWYLAWPGFEYAYLPEWPSPWSVQGLMDEESLKEMTRELFQ